MATKQDRREEILQSMLELVVERGINDAPMSELAKRSGASAGIMYHYFSNKDDIIKQLYFSIKARMVKSLVVDLHDKMPEKQAFVQVWMNAYNFYRDHPNETKFLAQYEILPCYEKGAPAAAVMNDPNYRLFERFFKTKKEGGMLKDLPFEVTAELTVGVAARLAKQSDAYDQDLLQTVAEICWRSVLAE